jgi:hypothetical protein
MSRVRIALPFTVLLTAARAFALESYHIGNSLMDLSLGVAYLSTQAGFAHSYSRTTVPGAPLDWIWDHNYDDFHSNLTTHAWDALLLEPFDRSLAHMEWGDCCGSDIISVNHFVDEAIAGNPDAQVFVYSTWVRPTIDGYNYDSSWALPYPSSIRCREYFELLTDTVNGMRTDCKPLRIIPNGEVFYRLNQRIRTGTVPGITSIFDLYTDEHHLTDEGAYLVMLTVFATLFETDPQVIGTRLEGGAQIDASLAEVFKDVVWETVSTYAYTGVGGGVRVAATRSPLLIEQRASAAAYDLRGRLQTHVQRDASDRVSRVTVRVSPTGAACHAVLHP